MTEQITIHDFGPIVEAQLEIRDLTIFVGPQATGKSLAAQLIYYMRGLEALVPQSTEAFLGRRRTNLADKDTETTPDADSPLRSTLSGLEWWLGNDLSVYVTSQTELSWNPKSPSEQTEYKISWHKRGPELNQALDRRLREERGSVPRSQVYIPAGRALYSFLPPASALRFFSSARSRLKWPGYIPTFYEALADALDQLWKEQEQGRQLPLLEAMIDGKFLRERIDAIFKGQIRYGPDTVSLEVKRKSLRAETIAAGQMEMWPFWAILQVNFGPGIEISRIYFEEPEAHLHPEAQRSVMEIIAYLVGREGQFVITTHSPYILYAINNSLMAHKVLDAGQVLPPETPREIALHPKKVAAYRFSSDGIVHKILDDEVGLINEDELDRVADELGSTFTRLQERMGDVQ
jgi:hypothetical protein